LNTFTVRFAFTRCWVLVTSQRLSHECALTVHSVCSLNNCDDPGVESLESLTECLAYGLSSGAPSPGAAAGVAAVLVVDSVLFIIMHWFWATWLWGWPIAYWLTLQERLSCSQVIRASVCKQNHRKIVILACISLNRCSVRYFWKCVHPVYCL